MKRLSFLEKTKELYLYTDRYDTVTFFEIIQLYGSALCAFLVFLLSLPLMIFSTQIIALPLTFIIIILSTLLLFDERLWLLDSIKGVKVASPTLKKISGWVISAIEWIRSKLPEAPFYAEYETVFRKATPLLLIFAAFQVGFIQSPNTNYFSILSLILLSLGATLDDGYIIIAGFAVFLLGLI